MRNRKHLRRIPGKQVVIEEGEEEDKCTEVPRVLRPEVSAPAGPVMKDEIANPTVPESPTVSANPEPVQPEPVQPEPVQPDPVASEPRRSSWSTG